MEGGGNPTYQKSFVFVGFLTPPSRRSVHSHPGSISPKCTPTSFAHVEKSGTATAPRGKSGILIKMAFVSVGVRAISEIQQHAKYLCKPLQNSFSEHFNFPNLVGSPKSWEIAFRHTFFQKSVSKSMKSMEFETKSHVNTYRKRL